MSKVKNKLLTVLNIMWETDEDHPITSAQLVERLSEQGIECERKSVLRDISALIDCNYDIIRCANNKQGFYMASHHFEDWELKVLLDAVMGAKFLTEQNSLVLKEKLYALGSRDFRRTLEAVTPVPTNTRFGDPTTKNHIDILLRAVRREKMVAFRYTHLGPDCRPHLHRDGHVYQVSPYAMFWRDDKYYLICNYAEDDPQEKPLRFFRLDRIQDLEMLEKRALSIRTLLGADARQRLQEFALSTVNHFSGSPVSLCLRCRQNMVDILMDDFGPKLVVVQESDGKLLVTLPTSESEGLYRWLMQYSNMVELVTPVHIRDELKNRLMDAARQYGL